MFWSGRRVLRSVSGRYSQHLGEHTVSRAQTSCCFISLTHLKYVDISHPSPAVSDTSLSIQLCVSVCAAASLLLCVVPLSPPPLSLSTTHTHTNASVNIQWPRPVASNNEHAPHTADREVSLTSHIVATRIKNSNIVGGANKEVINTIKNDLI